MSTPNISINPALTTVAGGTFGTSWNGLIQGMAMPDPSTRFALAGGYLATTETLPMWGGVLVSEAIPTPQGAPPMTPAESLGGPIVRATNVLGGGTAANATGISVFDQNYQGVNSPQSEVPVVGTYGAVLFYRLGSGARIAVPCDPGLASLEGDPITQPVSWDYINQRLVAYQAAFGANTITAGSWSGGIVSLTTNSAHGISPGGVFTVSGIAPTGYNGTFVATAGTTGTNINFALAVTPGAYVSGGTLAAGGGALPCKILKFEIGNSMTVSYVSATNFANWNRAGSCALIQI